MLEQVDALPRDKGRSTARNRNGELDGREGAADMRWHVVETLIVMCVEVGILRYGPFKPGLQIGADFRRRILLDQKRGRDVLTEEGQQPFFDAAALAQSMIRLVISKKKKRIAELLAHVE
jgi:hypothetical protein